MTKPPIEWAPNSASEAVLGNYRLERTVGLDRCERAVEVRNFSVEILGLPRNFKMICLDVQGGRQPLKVRNRIGDLRIDEVSRDQLIRQCQINPTFVQFAKVLLVVLCQRGLQ